MRWAQAGAPQTQSLWMQALLSCYIARETGWERGRADQAADQAATCPMLPSTLQSGEPQGT